MAKDKPTQKHIKYVEGVLRGENKYKAALLAGYSKASARVPKLIENKKGFSHAVSVAAMKIAHEEEKKILNSFVSGLVIVAEKIASDLSKVSIAVDSLGNTKLSKEMTVVLLSHFSGASKENVENVLSTVIKLNRSLCQKKNQNKKKKK